MSGRSKSVETGTQNADEEFRQVAHNFNTQSTELHKSKTRKSFWFWLAVLVATCAIFVFQVGYDIARFVEEPVATSVEEVYSKELDFPRMSICKRYPLTKRFLQVTPGLADPNLLFFYMSALSYYPPMLDILESVNFSEFEAEYLEEKKKWGANTTIHDHIMENTAMTVKGTFHYCSLRGIEFDCADAINSSDYYEASFCFVMDKKTFTQTVPGLRGSLMVILSSEELVLDEWNSGQGWELWLGPSQEETTGTTSPISVTEHLAVDVKISKWVRKRLSTRKSPCQKGNRGWHVLRCLNDCDANASYSACGCVRVGAPNPTNVRNCNPGSEGYCAYNVSKSVTCDCGYIDCDTTDYRAEVLSKGSTNHNATIVKLYYESLSVMTMTQTKVVTLAGLVGTFGGQASLWLGIRCANVIQLLFYAFRAIASRSNRRIGTETTQTLDL